MKLSNKARLTMTSGRNNTMITTDASYLEALITDLVESIALVPQTLSGIAVLISLLGYSGLVGVGVSPLPKRGSICLTYRFSFFLALCNGSCIAVSTVPEILNRESWISAYGSYRKSSGAFELSRCTHTRRTSESILLKNGTRSWFTCGATSWQEPSLRVP